MRNDKGKNHQKMMKIATSNNKGIIFFLKIENTLMANKMDRIFFCCGGGKREHQEMMKARIVWSICVCSFLRFFRVFLEFSSGLQFWGPV
jgi:hypothetical protein